MLLLRIAVMFLFIVKPADINFNLHFDNPSLSWSFYYAKCLADERGSELSCQT